jgi:hypothetical protein
VADRPLNPPEEDKPEMFLEGELPAEHQELLKHFQAEQAGAEAAALFDAYDRGPEALRKALCIPSSNDDASQPNSET